MLYSGAWSTSFTFKNNCPYPVWPAAVSGATFAPLPLTGFELQPAASLSLDAPPKWSGQMWARHRCSTDSSGVLWCLSGDCGTAQVQCGGSSGIPPTTLVKFTLQGDGGKDFYNVSNVEGFNVPVSITPQGGSGGCSSAACPANINGECPNELQFTASDGTVVACKSACLAFETDQYCCTRAYNNPNLCTPTNYSKFFKNVCPQAYSYAYDDATSTFTCTGANYLITYCP